MCTQYIVYRIVMKRRGDPVTSLIPSAEAYSPTQRTPPEEAELASLSDSQRQTLKEALQGHNVFVTGVAGSGKSHWIRVFCEAMEARGRRHCRTASTGSAAWQIGGRTLHNFAGVGLAKSDVKWLVMDLLRKPDKVLEWQLVETLILDEVSMFQPAYLTKLDELARTLRRSKAVFGGIQLVMVGDYFQLPPVQKGVAQEVRYLFQAPLWRSLQVKCCLLTHNFRQQQDPAFQRLLRNVRLAQLTEDDIAQLRSRLLQNHPEARVAEMTKLCSFRASVEQINREALQKLPGQERLFEARCWMLDSRGEKQEPSQKELEDMKQKSFPVDWELVLKPGAQVLLCRNLDTQDGLFNGARGTVIDYRTGEDGTLAPYVQFETGPSLLVLPQRWEQKDGKRVVSVFQQVPLLLRYALTVHKSQGLTLRQVLVTMDFFEPGQGYVALSRVPSLQDLYLSNLDTSKLTTDPAVLEFYTREGLLGE